MANNEILNNKYQIDTTTLTVGQVFKNMKSMCAYLNQEYIAKGGSKEAQLKEWKRYIDWEKDGQKIIITDIYPTPLDKTDGRIVNGYQKYQKFIEDIMLAYLDSAVLYSENILNHKRENDSIELSLTLNQIMYVCGMVNEKYINTNIKNILVDMGYTMFNINDFFTRTKSKFRSIIDNALSNMNKRKIINYRKSVVIIDKDRHRIATDEEEEIVTNIEKQVLADMEYESIVNVFLAYKTDEYHRRINKYIKSEFGWDGVYRCYSIRVNRFRIELEKDYLKNTNQNNKLELNQRLTEFFNVQVQNKILKSNNKEMGDFQLPDNYESQQLELTDKLLSIGNINTENNE
jgi:hypothetical protein